MQFRAYILSSADEIGPESFPVAGGASLKQPRLETSGDSTSWIPEVDNLRAFMSQTEKAILERALAAANGAQAEAARQIGLSRSDFGYKLSKYHIKSL